MVANSLLLIFEYFILHHHAANKTSYHSDFGNKGDRKYWELTVNDSHPKPGATG